eukprot:GHVP01049798.1.p1 GENE.GHVP01049798.1~~GHVP01049798.1.p1  ORF type:complete len:221 (-),score=36.57 GHVP01049798.1:311-973(-)
MNDLLGIEWTTMLKSEIEKNYFSNLLSRISDMRKSSTVYPPDEDVFNAFKLTPFKSIKVVIVGQDPYHGPNQAMGLSFSVPVGVPVPPSLRNILKEAKVWDKNVSGDLTKWAVQGVFLLNHTLTVEKGKPNSHEKLGWDKFTDAAIQAICDNTKSTIFMLWGKFAQKKGAKINRNVHTVLEAGHPSPLSIKNFVGCDHFAQCNEILVASGRAAINWNVSN